jgi:hypothetical protein
MEKQAVTHTKPRAKVLGQDGNVFNILAICSRALKNAGLHQESDRMQQEVFASGSYDEALAIMMRYVEFV